MAPFLEHTLWVDLKSLATTVAVMPIDRVAATLQFDLHQIDDLICGDPPHLD